jgi:hypothetical protein
VKAPRFRIALVMVAVAIVALDIWAIGAMYDLRSGNQNMIDLLGTGAIPMANMLAIGQLMRLRRHESSPFLLGFQAFGAIALVLFVVGAIFFTEELVMSYLALFLRHIVKFIGQRPPEVLIPILFSGAIIMLGLPQLAFALLGGFLSRRYQITITKRPPSALC